MSRKLKEVITGTKDGSASEGVVGHRKPPEVVMGSGDSNVEGRPKLKGGEKWDVGTGKESVLGEKQDEKEKTTEEKDLEVELNSILKRSPSMFTPSLLPFPSKPLQVPRAIQNLALIYAPTSPRSAVIIFSKSYCPFSRKAKIILLEKYLITPAPFVVELDKHPLGAQLQDKLTEMTGRKTVPNVLISGKSIGGGDDVELLDSTGELVGKVRGMGGKRITEARLREK